MEYFFGIVFGIALIATGWVFWTTNRGLYQIVRHLLLTTLRNNVKPTSQKGQ